MLVNTDFKMRNKWQNFAFLIKHWASKPKNLLLI